MEPAASTARGSAARARAGEKRGGRVQALTRALALLTLLATAEDGMTLSEIARSTRLAPSTAHRLLTTLLEERFVQFLAEGSRWLIGVQAFVVGNGFLNTREICRIAAPSLRRLRDESGETANLAAEDDGMAVYLAQVESRQPMRAIAKTGGRIFLHASALGKALLAAKPAAEVKEIVSARGMPHLTTNTLETQAQLEVELKRVRRDGYGLDDEEYAIGLRCVAAAVLDEHAAPVAAVSVSGPTARIRRKDVARLGALVRQVAAEITSALGGRSL